MNSRNSNKRLVLHSTHNADVSKVPTGENDGIKRARANPQLTDSDRLIRLPEVLALLPISKSSWWAGVKDGQFPRPVKLGPRTTTWRLSDISALIERRSIQRGGQ